MQPAVFLDRDGTISEEVGYVNHIDRLRIYPWAAAAIKKLNDAGIPVVLITNQSGVGRGYFPESLVDEVHTKLRRELALAGARLDGIYYCPHVPNSSIGSYGQPCTCRKPNTGMLDRAARELNLDLPASFMVGDKYLDIETGFRVHAKGILVLSGYGKGEHLYLGHTWPRRPDFIADDLAAAVDFVLNSTPDSESDKHGD